MQKAILLFSALFVLQASAASSPALQVLAYGSDHGSWPADNLCFVANAHFTAFQGGWVLPHTCVGGVDTTTQLWYVKDGRAAKIGQSAQGNFFSDTAANDQAIAFTEYNESGTLSLTVSTLARAQTTRLPANWSSMFLRNLNVISPSEIDFRVLDINRTVVPGSLRAGQFTRLQPKGISYYFGAATSNMLRVEKLRLGAPSQTDDSQPDVLVVGVAPLFNAVVVARDHDADGSSQITAFDNTASVQGERWALLALAGPKPLLLRGLGTQVEIVPLSALFSVVEHFMPAILSDGRVALRATDQNGVQGLWLIDLQDRAQLLLQKGAPLTTPRGGFVIGKDPFVTGPASSGDDVVIGVGLDDAKTGEPMEQDVLRLTL